MTRWSPLHELVPETPLRHGHAISIDMAYSATLAHTRGLLSNADHERLLRLFSRAGLSMDHVQFDEALLDKATTAILKTRDGKLRAAVPISPIGECVFLNDVSHAEMCKALAVHKESMKGFDRHGDGLDAYVDSSDTGYDLQSGVVEGVSGSQGAVGRDVVNQPKLRSGLDGIENGVGDSLKELMPGREGVLNVVSVNGNGSP